MDLENQDSTGYTILYRQKELETLKLRLNLASWSIEGEQGLLSLNLSSNS